jgi:hypothetical protein
VPFSAGGFKGSAANPCSIEAFTKNPKVRVGARVRVRVNLTLTLTLALALNLPKGRSRDPIAVTTADTWTESAEQACA